MKAFTFAAVLAAVGNVIASPTPTNQEPPSKRASLPKVTASGTAFWADGKRFYLRGIDYQPGGSSSTKDPLADTATCKRDIQHFKDLGINTIRVYSIDNSKNHDECMKELADAGIYLVLDVNNSGYSLNRADPFLSYNAKYLQSVFATVEEFAKYENTLAFFSGNEVINDQPNTDKSAPYIKAVTRDIKNYMASRKLRQVMVGYSAADVAQNRWQTAEYMNCGSDDARPDFFAFNDYSWCNSDFVTSGWDAKVKQFGELGIPIFLSEWGCNKNRPRKFEELGALMSDKMSSVYSGGIMYEYSNEPGNNYGIVQIKGDSVEEMDEYSLFKKALAKYPTPTGDGGAAKETHSSKCPAKDKDWQIDSQEIPVMPEQADVYLDQGAGKGPGFGGGGSQTAGKSGTATASTTAGKSSATGSGSGSGDGSDEDSAALSLVADKSAVAVSAFAAVFAVVGAALL